MQKQNQATFVMRIAGSTQGQSSALSEGNNTASQPVDLMAAYRTSRIAGQQSLSSMRIGPGSFRTGGAYFRRAA